MNKWKEIISFLVLLTSISYLYFSFSSKTFPIGAWGTYRPNVYFGVKRKSPDSPLMGLAWFNTDGEWWEKIRHDAEERDSLARWGYLEHTGESYGSQEIIDQENGMFLRTSFVRTEDDKWVARISGLPLEENGPPRNASLLWYVALQSSQDSFGFPSTLNSEGIDGDINLKITLGSEDYRMIIPKNVENKHPKVHGSFLGLGKNMHMNKHSYYATEIDENVWDTKTIVKNVLMKDAGRIFNDWQKKNSNKKKTSQQQQGPTKIVARFPNSVDVMANFFVVQQIFTLPFTFDVIFQPEEKFQKNLSDTEHVSGLFLDSSTKFNLQFSQTFQLNKKGFNKSQETFAQTALSNMLGGIGHFYGNTLVQQKANEDEQNVLVELFSAVPSRSFFPRGFLWDEGFHQLLISEWDENLSMEILSSWFNLVDSEGWIQREVIAGEEARRRVPREFQTQKPHIANPPTLLLAIEKLIQRANAKKLSGGNITQITQFLRVIHPAIQRYTNWYIRTQASKGAGEWSDASEARTFRWAGRTQGHCLASGLDDYPRASWISEQEGHVDLHSWIIFITKTAGEIAKFLGETLQAEKLFAHSQRLLSALDEMHWNEKSQTYCDYAYREQKKQFICHDGYISLFPFMLQHLSPSSPQFKASLSLLSDETKIWSDYGILSLSRKDKFFGKDENYWRGNIWLNLNYLSLRALRYYAQQDGPYRELSASLESRLRANLIQNLHLRYKLQGFLFEQYNWQDGKGVRTHPFTGWTATAAVLAMSEAPFVDSANKK